MCNKLWINCCTVYSGNDDNDAQCLTCAQLTGGRLILLPKNEGPRRAGQKMPWCRYPSFYSVVEQASCRCVNACFWTLCLTIIVIIILSTAAVMLPSLPPLNSCVKWSVLDDNSDGEFVVLLLFMIFFAFILASCSYYFLSVYFIFCFGASARKW